MKTKFIFIGLIFAMLCTTESFAQDYFYSNQMTDEEYQEELERWDKKRQHSMSRATQLQNDITRLNEDIARLSENITKVRRETLQILNAVADNSLQTKRGQILLSEKDRDKSKMD